VKIALDPYMHRHLSLEELPRKVADLGYEYIEPHCHINRF